ncbi:squalene/phytoene synthase family protein [Paraburkholderia bonniea]|uniref:squalene/phytoene synthase family protein n=1 Tax=Paraburkholderia bonniea TaxID=2152891 RepID=UPI0012928018|nr:squalene/phytoene synthase family protein [Paraburkholderia bonniea]WJF91406.1 squalene/phytoene synthase family protein [Paraburkholderia bonniea]WJF94723.1 squalene/phytoene synthase family protein [Paraburkholderia bonniea]
MNFDDYCQQKAAPPGSSTYYALKRAPATYQPLLTALFALRKEFEETVKEMSDPAIGRTRFAWWQQEIAALAAGQPTHPVSQALAAHAEKNPLEYPALQALLAGYAMDLDQARYLDYPNLRRYLNSVGGAFAVLVARTTARDPLQASQWAAPLGEALMLAQIIDELGRDARCGRIYIPVDEMQRFNVIAADLINGRYSDEFTSLMRFQTARARDALHLAQSTVPAAERRWQGTLRAQVALALALLDEIERDGYQVLHQRVALTPIRKLWITWRATYAS